VVGIRDGDLATVRSEPECGDGVMGVAGVLLLDGAEATLKRVYRNGPSVTLEPANAAMQPLEVSAERVEVRGVVVGIVRLGL
jgi:repressor LexA